MKEKDLALALALAAAITAAYVAYLLVGDAAELYQNTIRLTGGNWLKGGLIAAFITSASISAIAVAVLINFRSRSWLLIPLMAHVAFVVLGWPSYLLFFIVLIWWFSEYVYTNT